MNVQSLADPRFTLVTFHAHPDDEALLTSGTMARAAAEGHRVVCVVATAGDAGRAADTSDLGARRLRELQKSADALGVARVVCLDYGDSGLPAPGQRFTPASGTFCATGMQESAAKLAEILREERADVLTTYDARGGYGHPDHRRVHHVGWLAADLAEVECVLQATVDRTLLVRALKIARRLYRFPPEFDAAGFMQSYSPRAEITHRVTVRRFARVKRDSMRAHASQAGADDRGDRTLGIFGRVPLWLFRLVFGTEYYSEIGRPAPAQLDDIFATVRARRRA
ncbi:PIG-L family deacetylase [Micrococcales bacterium 31B]|nr:PIG-L family deacetylase [Micrococcales bacterium 31B]